MKKLLNMLKKDENTLSIGRLCAVLAFILFCVISLYLALFVKTWGNYEAFAMACVSFMLAQLGNKYVETRAFKVSDK
jgi:ABC-type multidrug transport system permease subunit